jgi:NADH-quinone oxidoreductase subunit K
VSPSLLAANGGLLLAALPSLKVVVLLAMILFSIGLVGVTCRKNILIVLLSVEIMLNAANVALVAFSRVHGDVTGQVFVFFAMTVAAAEVAVGLAIVITVYRLRRSTDISETRELREIDYGPVVFPQLEGENAPHHHHHHEHDDGHGHDEAEHAVPAPAHSAGGSEV